MNDRPTYHGEELLSAEDLAVLLGVPVDLLKACANAQLDPDNCRPQSTRFPAAWFEQGRSRTDVYRQATGRDDMEGALEFWRAQHRCDDSPETPQLPPGGTA